VSNSLVICLVLLTVPQLVFAQLADPTRPPTAESKPVYVKPRVTKPDELLLSAVINSGARKVAIINGKPLSVGERIENSTVVAIASGKVHLRKSRLEYTIYLPSYRINKQDAGGMEAAP
jgi:hypothetical protein